MFRHAPPSGRDRRACPFPRPRLYAQGRLRQRHDRGRDRRSDHRVRHAEHEPDRIGTRGAEAEAKMAAEKAYVDFGLYAVLGEDRSTHLPALGRSRRHRLQALHGQHVRQAAVAVDRRDARSFRDRGADRQAHLAACGNHLDHGAARELHARRGRTDPLAHLASRPAVVAIEAVSRAAILAEWTGARIHILHISSADELRPLREAKARGVDITGETCPHYLCSRRRLRRFGRIIRVNPPVREKQQPGTDLGGARRRNDRHASRRTTRRTRARKRRATTSSPSIAAFPASKRRCR